MYANILESFYFLNSKQNNCYFKFLLAFQFKNVSKPIYNNLILRILVSYKVILQCNKQIHTNRKTLNEIIKK